MMASALRATIERRLLVNYRIDADVLASVLPRPFRPAMVSGFGVAGICLIRLAGIRPVGLPAALGLTAESAAHRVAVEWDAPDGAATGVYIPRRDTASRLISMLGGRVFPGWHHLADFEVDEKNGNYRIGFTSRDQNFSVDVRAGLADAPMAGSVFTSVEAASSFFRWAPVGYAATPRPGVFDGVEMGTCGWDMRSLVVEEARSTFFENSDRFPAGTATLDSAFVMSRIATTWTPRPRLLAGDRM